MLIMTQHLNLLCLDLPFISVFSSLVTGLQLVIRRHKELKEHKIIFLASITLKTFSIFLESLSLEFSFALSKHTFQIHSKKSKIYVIKQMLSLRKHPCTAHFQVSEPQLTMQSLQLKRPRTTPSTFTQIIKASIFKECCPTFTRQDWPLWWVQDPFLFSH